MYTDKERSIRLKVLGFEGEYEKYSDNNHEVEEYHDGMLISTHIYPAYSADTLFDWLREWARKENHDIIIGIDATIITQYDPPYWKRNVIYSNSITNMLADAIIFILKQERENG